MGSHWNPKPLRGTAQNPLFEMTECSTVVKGLSPMQRQRLADGTPPTRTAATSLRPADPELVLRSDLVKGSLAEKYAKRPEQPRMDPPDPLSVVKSYLAWDPDAKAKKEAVAKSQTSVERMQATITNLLKKVRTNRAVAADDDSQDR